jgi:tetratricopeptide (TPR) repeat protein
VEGTEFFIKVADNKTYISVFEGKVIAANASGEVGLTDGQSAVAEAGKAPVLRVVAQPRDAVRWALHYPPVIDGTSPDSAINRSAQLLSVGRVDEASTKIEQSLRLNPKNIEALSLKSIIAVVLNNKDEALSLASKAVEADPKSATARIALSYAQQAGFDLEGARASLEEAVALAPENALAWARLAELWSSFGYLGKSLDAAQKAVELDPNLSRTQTVLGFAYLTQVKTAMAKDAFDKAIMLDQADALPRLGLGLAKIRDGQLAEGRRDIEIAASLDSNNSIIRSYLGKAYFEEKRTELDGREYAMAKELDPNDPTPWFYNAIRKQTINQPVAALHDLQKAIELNDNRAVYRSKLMLDSDLAARSASLARIYSDLGFQQRALVEGYNSVNTDPTNHSAHRFLADSYSVLPRHEIARVSELLQSQLLQPTNITPIQPRLAESNLQLISSSGAGNASFNEFNPLFNRNQIALLASGLIGENSTGGGEAVVSGIYNKASFSVGYSKFQTDGFRENNDQEDDIANAYLQYELSYKTSLQAEYRHRKSESGDLLLTFDPEDFFPDERTEDDIDSFRLGFRHNFNPSSILIGNFQYQDFKGILTDEFPDVFTLDVDTAIDGFGGELQYLHRAQKFNITGGAGYFDLDGEEKINFSMFGEPFPEEISSQNTTHTNIYAYSNIYLLNNLTVTVGASGDFFETDKSDAEDTDQFNPKLGIIWNPMPDTTIRAAAFRVLKRTLVTDQTLEPTQVAGFNQFFDDINASDVWRYGGAIDQKFSQEIYGGLEFSKRDLDVPYFDFAEDAFGEVAWDEQLGRAYLFWTPHNWFSLSGQYIYEKTERDERAAFNVKELKTHRIPLGVNFFHPSGISVSLITTYYNQEGEFEIEPGVFESGEDDFWILDAAISYRLPKRYGFITVGANNLLDEEFKYFDTDNNNTTVQPVRTVFGRITLAF